MSNALQRYEAPASAPLAITNFDDVMRVADACSKSGFFSDSRQAAQACIKIMAGMELGMGPIEAMQSFHVVKDKLTMSANALAQRIKRHPSYDYRVLDLTPKVCRLEFFQDGQSIGVSEFTATEAQVAGTQNMQKYPKNMLFARAISNGVKWYCPDVVSGTIYTPEEFESDDTPARAPLRLAPEPEPVKAESAALISEDAALAIENLWAALESLTGKDADLNAYCRKKGFDGVRALHADIGAKIISDLTLTLETTKASLTVPAHSSEAGAAIEAAIARAEAAGIRPDQWQAQMGADYKLDAVADLSEQQIVEFADLLNAWAEAKEKKAQAAQLAQQSA